MESFIFSITFEIGRFLGTLDLFLALTSLGLATSSGLLSLLPPFQGCFLIHGLKDIPNGFLG